LNNNIQLEYLGNTHPLVTHSNIQKMASSSEPTKASTNNNEVMSRIIGAQDHFSALGLPMKKVSCDVVKRVYYKLALLVHPDKNLNNSQALVAFQQVSLAYEKLGEPLFQAEYLDNILNQRNSEPQQSHGNNANKPPPAKTKSEQQQQQQQQQQQHQQHQETSGRSKKPKKTYEEMLSEWKEMELLFEASNEEKQNKKRANDIRRENMRYEQSIEVSRKSAVIVDALSDGADDRASDWRNFRFGHKQSSKKKAIH
jgi:curved DNA-binding protein CbpA